MTNIGLYYVFLRTPFHEPTRDEVRKHVDNPCWLPEANFVATTHPQNHLDLSDVRLEVLAAKLVWARARAVGLIEKVPANGIETPITTIIITSQNMTMQFDFRPPYAARMFGQYRQYTAPLPPPVQEEFLEHVSAVMTERFSPTPKLTDSQTNKYVIIDNKSGGNGTAHSKSNL